MAESYIFFKQSLEKTMKTYKDIYDKLLENECVIEPMDDDSFMCNNMNFYEISDTWCVGDNIEGNTYAIERLLELAGNEEIIYLYFDEDTLEGELVVIKERKIVRKLYDYYFTPELNENVGKLEYEETRELNNWINIASYSEYLFEYL
ncbi:MAG: hypothetical protein IJN16_07155 [Lachnospiraceae bacterium]|nr:hypothetical protein [Lachnospiraceae bacterium]